MDGYLEGTMRNWPLIRASGDLFYYLVIDVKNPEGKQFSTFEIYSELSFVGKRDE